MMGIALPLILVLGLVVVVVVVAVQRSTSNRDEKGDGADIVPYLVLALSVGVAGFALAELAATAFPSEQFVFDPADEVATSLSALLVSSPFAIYFWRRQAHRRTRYPGSTGWALYLSVIELVFMVAFVVTAIMFLNGLFSDQPASTWTRAVVFGAVVVLHEWAARTTPPVSDAGELRRVIGSAIGLVVISVGGTGLLAGLFAAVYEGVTAATPIDPGFHPWIAMSLVGIPLWWYRWLRPWDTEPGAPRLTWLVVVVVGALATALGAATAILVQIVEYLATETVPAADHFEPIPLTAALILVGTPVWMIHRVKLGQSGGNPLRVYRYAMAALGLGTSVSMLIALTIAVLDRTLIVGASARDIVTLAVVLVIGLTVWLVFERRAPGEDTPDGSWPRNLYALGVGILFGLVAAGALITTLFILIRRLIDDAGTGSILQPTTVLLFTGLASWYLLASYFRSREAAPAKAAIAPFEVTVICSHPGMIAARFPEQARLRVVYRGDDVGVIDESMADEIVAEVGNRPSLVWVDADGFRVAPIRTSG